MQSLSKSQKHFSQIEDAKIYMKPQKTPIAKETLEKRNKAESHTLVVSTCIKKPW